MQKQKIIVLLGPTASGKSTLAVELAKKFNGEVISADSRQGYKALDVGTGKITKREMKGVRHHLLDVVSPKKVFTAHDFTTHLDYAVANIECRGKIPIMCGGSGFYIDAALGRIRLADVPRNAKLRAQLEKLSAAELFARLARLDKRRAATIDKHNKHRLVRAIEIAAATRSRIAPVRLHYPDYDLLWVGLNLDAPALRESINKRLKERLRRGMIAEARRLHAAGLSYKRMYDLGLEYRSLARYLKGELTRSQLEEELQKAIWQYARRQMTYWRQNKEIKWFDPKRKRDVQKTVRSWLNAS